MRNYFATRLSIARYRAGMSMTELAEKVNLSKQAISKYESGAMLPEIEVKKKLAEALSVEQAFLDQPNSKDGLIMSFMKHREKHRADNTLIKEVKERTLDALIKFMELEVIADSKMDFQNPIADLTIENVSEAEKAAKQLRKKWGLGDQPIRNVILLLEEKGIKVFTFNLPLGFQGLSAFTGRIPLIVLNGSIEEKTRLRFAAIHELGHLLLRIPDFIVDNDLVEKICDAFAGEFLFPGHIAVLELGRTRSQISLEELVSLKKKYGLSIQALMSKARYTNIITSEIYSTWKYHYKSWVESSSDLGKYNHEETPERFNSLIFHCLVEGLISVSKAAELKNIKELQLKKIMSETESYYKPINNGNYY